MDYITSIQYLTQERWAALTIDGKINVLQSIENEIAQREGRTPCIVEKQFIPSTKDGITLGFYSQDSRTITINTEQLGNDSKYGNDYSVHLDTILHEGRHAYQHQAVLGELNHVDEESVQKWSNNMAPGHYVEFEKNPRGYYAQPIEQDARQFATIKEYEIEQEKNTLFSYNMNREEQPAVLVRDKDKLMRAGKQNIEDILEVMRDNLRDKGMNDGTEMEQIIDRERINLQFEFENDAFGSSSHQSNEIKEIDILFGDFGKDDPVEESSPLSHKTEDKYGEGEHSSEHNLSWNAKDSKEHKFTAERGIK